MSGIRKLKERVGGFGISEPAIRQSLLRYYKYKAKKSRRAFNSINRAGVAPLLVELYLSSSTIDEALLKVKGHGISRSAIGRFFSDLRKANVNLSILYE